MKRKAAAILAALVFACGSAYASDLTDITPDREQISTGIDNSNLQVEVEKYIGNTKVTIFTGKLKDYDDGKWTGLDFSKISFAVIYDWDTADDEVIYIIPTENMTVAREDISIKPGKEQEKSDANSVQQGLTDVSDITYDVEYTISGDNMNILYSAENTAAESQTVSLIAALYKNGALQKVISAPLEINDGKSGNITMLLPQTEKEKCSVKMMVWESTGKLRPLGAAKTVNDIEPYLREKTTTVLAASGREFNIYLNAENVIGNNSAVEHIIKYNPQHLEPTDLCGFTYEKELAPGKIENTGITIKSVDTQNGEIIFNFDLPEGRNTGINNIVKFKALSDVFGEEIVYEIQ